MRNHPLFWNGFFALTVLILSISAFAATEVVPYLAARPVTAPTGAHDYVLTIYSTAGGKQVRRATLASLGMVSNAHFNTYSSNIWAALRGKAGTSQHAVFANLSTGHITAQGGVTVPQGATEQGLTLYEASGNGNKKFILKAAPDLTSDVTWVIETNRLTVNGTELATW